MIPGHSGIQGNKIIDPVTRGQPIMGLKPSMKVSYAGQKTFWAVGKQIDSNCG